MVPPKSGYTISYILFADDVLVFAREDVDNAKRVNEIFSNFAEVSGLMINPSKSHLIMGDSESCVDVQSELGVLKVDLPV